MLASSPGLEISDKDSPQGLKDSEILLPPHQSTPNIVEAIEKHFARKYPEPISPALPSCVLQRHCFKEHALKHSPRRPPGRAIFGHAAAEPQACSDCFFFPLIPGHPHLDAICIHLHIEFPCPLLPPPQPHGMLGKTKLMYSQSPLRCVLTSCGAEALIHLKPGAGMKGRWRGCCRKSVDTTH